MTTEIQNQIYTLNQGIISRQNLIFDIDGEIAKLQVRLDRTWEALQVYSRAFDLFTKDAANYRKRANDAKAMNHVKFAMLYANRFIELSSDAKNNHIWNIFTWRRPVLENEIARLHNEIESKKGSINILNDEIASRRKKIYELGG